MNTVKLLLLEDLEMDAALIQKVLQRAGMDFTATIAAGRDEFVEAIQHGTFDAILADNSLPQFDAERALQIIKEHNLNTPFILVTGTVSEEFAVNMMMAGAWDYILKDRLQRLPNAILAAIKKYGLEKQQKQNLEELIKNEGLLKRSERLAHLGSWETDMHTLVTHWSDEYYCILDYEQGEAEPAFADFVHRVHADDKEFVKKTVENALFSLGSQKYNCRVVHKNGSVKYLENELFVTRNGDNKVTHLNGFSRDITLQTETDLSLAKSRKEAANYKYAIDESSSVAITDNNGVVLKANDHFCKISKYSRNELVGQNINMINSGFHTKEFMQNLWETISGGNVWKGEIKNKAKDNTYYWVSATIVPILNGAGKPQQYLSIKRDITKRKEGEQKLKDSEALYRNIVETSQEGIWTIDKDNKITFANSKLCAVLEYSLAELIGQSFLNFTDEEGKARATAAIEATKNGIKETHDFMYITKSGRHVCANTDFNPIASDDGKQHGVFAMVAYIHERKPSDRQKA